MGDVNTPDIADIYCNFSVNMTPLASISVSGVDATSGPDLSVAASISVKPGTYADTDRGSIRNPSLYTWSVPMSTEYTTYKFILRILHLSRLI